jgi:molybdopterin-guanine dinucleotide biosynthesis protein
MAITIGITGPDKETRTVAAEQLIAELTARGFAVGSVKSHSHGDFDLDRPGKATYRHRAAGAQETVMASATMLAYVRHREQAPTLAEAVSYFSSAVDIIVSDGWFDDADMKVTAPLADAAAVADQAERDLLGKDG